MDIYLQPRIFVGVTTMSQNVPRPAHGGNLSLRSYIVGFILSLALTLSAYFIVTHQTYNKQGIIAAVATLAITQFVVQMIFFMHLGQEAKPYWNLLALIFMLGVVIIIVIGSLWIMDHLNYNIILTSVCSM